MASEYDLEALLGRFAERAIANKVAEQLAMGVGGGTAPHGVFYTSVVTAGVTAASSTAVTMDEMLGLMKSVPKGYRKASKLVVSDVLHSALFQAKGDDGQYYLRSVDGGGTTFAGVPIFCEPQANQTSMSASEVHAVAGDFASLFVRTTPMFLKRIDGTDPLNPIMVFAIWTLPACVVW